MIYTVLKLAAAVALLAFCVLFFILSREAWRRQAEKRKHQPKKVMMMRFDRDMETDETPVRVHLFHCTTRAEETDDANSIIDRLLPPSRPVHECLLFRFDSDKGTTYWLTYVDNRQESRRFTVGRIVQQSEIIKGSVKYLGFLNASPSSVIQETTDLAWDLGDEEAPCGLVLDPSHNWARMLFFRLSTRFDVYKDGEEELERNIHLNSSYVRATLIRKAPVEFDIVIKEKDREVKRFSMNRDNNSFISLLNVVCAHLEKTFDWFKDERLVRVSVNNKQDEIHNLGVMLSFEDYHTKTFDCLYVKMLSHECDDGQATGFSVGYWKNEWPFEQCFNKGNLISSGRALVKGFAMTTIESKQTGNAPEIIKEFFGNLSPIIPSIQTFGEADGQLLQVTVHFYIEYFAFSGHGVLSLLRRFAGIFGHQVRHWGLIFEWEDNVFCWSMYGDEGRLPHEDSITVRLRIGKPDETLQLRQERLGSTRLSRKQLLEYARDFERMEFPTPFDVYTVNCHGWASKFYNHIAPQLGMSVMTKFLFTPIEWIGLFLISLVLIFLEMYSLFSVIVLVAAFLFMRQRQLLI